ncbi:MAG: hypothetical protein ACR2MB_00010 [Acidimicrobiales bacterium]
MTPGDFASSVGLPVRRSYEVDTERLSAVVVEVDATEDERALAVLQASLHEAADGYRLVYGYDVATVGLGAWVGDRRVRLTVWPALVDGDGDIAAQDPDDPHADVLAIDFDPVVDADALAVLARRGRLLVAGPESGPVPLVLDIDRDLLVTILDELASG